ncbi:MAG: pantoate--beta-alanine ligase [Saprospiraceae bacterium]|nr:pantoate--beta-alanine ligase [Candidatus Opimibacter skivensis]
MYGSEDFQQFSIIRKLIADFQMPIHACDAYVREGEWTIAMSSRNVRLSPEEEIKPG